MSTTKKFGEIVQDVIERIAEQTGTSVQIYSQPVVESIVQSLFDTLFDLEFWPQYTAWYTWTLDGTTGVVVDNLADIVKRYEDIQSIWRPGARTPLPKLTHTANPFNLNGTSPKFIELYNGSKFFRIWPLTATGDVNARVRTKPDPFADETTVTFDSEVLVLGAAWQKLEDDESNPGSVEKFRNLFEQRVKTLRQGLGNINIPLNPHTNTINDEWIER